VLDSSSWLFVPKASESILVRRAKKSFIGSDGMRTAMSNILGGAACLAGHEVGLPRDRGGVLFGLGVLSSVGNDSGSVVVFGLDLVPITGGAVGGWVGAGVGELFMSERLSMEASFRRSCRFFGTNTGFVVFLNKA
jgi:hypothetical protein